MIHTRWAEPVTTCVRPRVEEGYYKYMIETKHTDLMRIQRLKKRKLMLKDQILMLESQLIPDLNA